MMTIEPPENQPQPPDIKVPFIDGNAYYSRMPIADLMKLREYMDDLIKWIASGNPVYIGSVSFTVEYDDADRAREQLGEK